MTGQRTDTMVSLKTAIVTFASGLHRRAEGQGLAEYALILSLVAVTAMAGLTGVGSAIVGMLGQMTNSL